MRQVPVYSTLESFVANGNHSVYFFLTPTLVRGYDENI